MRGLVFCRGLALICRCQILCIITLPALQNISCIYSGAGQTAKSIKLNYVSPASGCSQLAFVNTAGSCNLALGSTILCDAASNASMQSIAITIDSASNATFNLYFQSGLL